MRRLAVRAPFFVALLFAQGALCNERAAAQTAAQATAQATPATPAEISAAVARACAAELRLLDAETTSTLRFTLRKIDAKGTSTRRVIDTPDGVVTRAVARNGQPLTPEEDAAERGRLQAMLDDPAIIQRTRKRNETARHDSAELIRLLPAAFVYTQVADAPPRPGAARAGTGPGELVLNFAPNPAFHPPTLASEALTGIEGRVWLDPRSGYLTHLEGRFRSVTNIGFGMLARIFPGGTVHFTQSAPDGEHFVFEHLDAHLTLRELMVRTQQENTQLDYSDYQLLPARLTWREAVARLLAEPVPLR